MEDKQKERWQAMMAAANIDVANYAAAINMTVDEVFERFEELRGTRGTMTVQEHRRINNDHRTD